MSSPEPAPGFGSRQVHLPLPERRDVVALASLLILVLILFRRAVFAGEIFFERDLHLLWYGQAENFVRGLLSGAWPLWNPRIAFGEPFLANPSAQVLYPWTWLNLIVSPGPAYTFYAVSHVFLAAVGVYLLGRSLEISSPGSATAAAAWVLSGPFLSLVSLWHHLAGAAWMPLVCRAGDDALRIGTRAHVLRFGGLLGLQILAGSADMCAMTLLFVTARGLRLVPWRRPLSAGSGRLLLSGLTAFLIAAALSAGQWLPALDVARGSGRWGLADSIRSFWSLHPSNLVQMLVPVFPQELPLRLEYRALLYESREPFMNSVYLGVATLPLAAAALFGGSRRLAVLLATLWLGAAFVALGKYGVAYSWVTWLFPPLAILRYPSKVMVLASLCWAILCGMGLDVWRERAKEGLRRPIPAVTLVCGLGAALVAFGVFVLRDRPGWAAGFLLAQSDPLSVVLAPTVRRLWIAALCGGAALACTLIWWRPLAARRSAALGMLALLDLFQTHDPLNQTAPADLFFRPPAIVGLLPGDRQTRVYSFDYSMKVLGKTYRRETPGPPPAPPPGLSPLLANALVFQRHLGPPLAERWGYLGSYDLDRLSLYPRYLLNLNLFFRAAEETPAFLRLLQVAGVGVVVARHRVGLEDLAPLASMRYEPSDPMYVFRVPGTRPHTYAVGRSRVVDGFAALKTLVDPAFDATQEILLSEGRGRTAAGAFRGTSRLLERIGDRVRVEADLSEPGYVVLLEGFAPGWRATVDGREVRVFRANVAFRAVEAPAGRHVVEFRYRPRSVALGLSVSALSLALIVGVAVRAGALHSRGA